MGFYQILPLQDRVELGIMAMKGLFPFLISSELERHHQMKFSVIIRTLIFCGWYRILTPRRVIHSMYSKTNRKYGTQG